MSELGSKKGQSENKNAPVFDSLELETKQKTDHFVNVKDAEARKKEAERKAKEVEKKAENEHKEAVKEAAKKANKEVRGSKGGIRNLLFGGWHKWVVIVIILIIIALVIVMLMTSLKREDTDKPAGRAETVYEEALKTANYESYNPDYYLGEKVIVDAISSSTNDEEKALLRIALARYYSEMYGYYGEAIKMLDEIEKEYDFSRSDDCFIVGSLSIIYTTSSENDKREKYNNRLNELKCFMRETDDGQAE